MIRLAHNITLKVYSGTGKEPVKKQSLYPNWPVIAELKHPALTMLFATLDFSSPLGCKIMKQVPECVSNRETTPIPFSALRESVRQYYAEWKTSDAVRWYVEHCLYMAPLASRLPRVKFWIDETMRDGPGTLNLPAEINPDLPAGSFIKWKGSTWTTISTKEAGELVLVPSNCVDPGK